MNSRSFTEDKENYPSKRAINTRKSLGNQKQSLNLSGILKTTEKEDINELNNQFTDYIDYVRSIETLNEALKNEKQSIIDSFEYDINNIRSTYGNEINSLRKALDDVTTTKATLVIENKSLHEEKEKLSIKLKNESNALIVLKKEHSELEENLNNYRKKMEKYEHLIQEHNELIIENSNNLKELKAVLYKHAELESRFITLHDEIEFYKKVSSNAKTSFDNKIVSVQNTMVNRAENHAEEVAAIRLEFTEEFEQYKESLEKMYTEKFENLSKISEKSSTKCNSLYNEKKMLKITAEQLNNEIYEKDNQIATLLKRISNHNDLLNKVNLDHENYIRDITEENINFKKELESKINELTAVINEKIEIEKELYMFRSLLEGEQSRCNIGDVSSPKKRRKPVGDDYDINAWSNDAVKIFCDEQYNGSHIQILNDSENDRNINEWKVEVGAEDKVEVYSFPDRTLKAGSFLKLWKSGQEVVEDDENVLMNITLPFSDYMTCKLTNDMDEIEAYFELRKASGARKILKAKKKNMDKEGCCIM